MRDERVSRRVACLFRVYHVPVCVRARAVLARAFDTPRLSRAPSERRVRTVRAAGIRENTYAARVRFADRERAIPRTTVRAERHR